MKTKGKIRLNLSEMRKLAGLPLKEMDDIYANGDESGHEEREHEVFTKCVKACREVMEIALEQLGVVGEEDPRHADYQELVESTQHHVDLLEKHLARYESEDKIVEIPGEKLADMGPKGPAIPSGVTSLASRV